MAKQKCRVHIVQSWAVFVYACSARTQVSFSSVLHTDRRPITINKSESPPLEFSERRLSCVYVPLVDPLSSSGLGGRGRRKWYRRTCCTVCVGRDAIRQHSLFGQGRKRTKRGVWKERREKSDGPIVWKRFSPLFGA